MTRKEARTRAKALASLMAALNSQTKEGGDPLAHFFGMEEIKSGARPILPKLQNKADARKLKARLMKSGTRGRRIWEEVILQRTARLAPNLGSSFVQFIVPAQPRSPDKPQPVLLSDFVSKPRHSDLLLSNPGIETVDVEHQPNLQPGGSVVTITWRDDARPGIVQIGGKKQKPRFQQFAVQLREWIDVCAGSNRKTAALLRKLQQRRMPATERTAFMYLEKIAALGIFRCHGCGKLSLNTSGHARRKRCSGATCDRIDSRRRLMQRQIMARGFAELQAEKAKRVKVAIRNWPGVGDLREWIVEQDKHLHLPKRETVTKRWITEAARRGDVHLPGVRQ